MNKSTIDQVYVNELDTLFDINDIRVPAIGTGDAGKVLSVGNDGKYGLAEINTGHDFTHAANTTIGSSELTVTFAANQRGSRMVTVSDDLNVTFEVNNSSDNYLWVSNIGSSDADITVGTVTHGGATVSTVYMPSDGITVPSDGLCEISIVCNTDGAFITSRGDLVI